MRSLLEELDDGDAESLKQVTLPPHASSWLSCLDVEDESLLHRLGCCIPSGVTTFHLILRSYPGQS